MPGTRRGSRSSERRPCACGTRPDGCSQMGDFLPFFVWVAMIDTSLVAGAVQWPGVDLGSNRQGEPENVGRIRHLGCSVTVAQLTLDQFVGVRIPAPQLQANPA